MSIETLRDSTAASTVPSACPFHSIGTEFNPLAPDQVADPFSFYARAQQEEPLFFSAMFNTWVATRYDDISAILRDTEHFSSVGIIGPVTEYTPEVQAILDTAIPPFANALVNLDAPQHTRIRANVNKLFSARRVASFEPRIREIANRLVDLFIGAGHADLIAAFNYPLPAMVIFNLIGVSEEDLWQVKRWSDDLAELLFVPLPPERQAECARSLVNYQRYIVDLVEQRRAAPQDDLASDLAQAIDRGEADLSIPELVELLLNLVFAGHETTASLLGTSLRHLLTEGHYWRAIQEDPQLIRSVVEEAIRFDGPSIGFFRIVAKSIEFNGVMLPSGARVFVLFSSANHDAAMFAEPEAFNPHRENVGRHLGFGGGIHYCIGAPLARLEMRIALETLSARLPSLRLAPNHQTIYKPSLTIRSLAQLMVEWDSEDQTASHTSESMV
jgi:cytochrome P450